MSIAIQLSSITPELKVQITKKCLVKPNVSQYNEDPAPVSCFAVNEEEDTVYLPLGVWKDFLDEFPHREYARTKVKCKKELYTLETDPKGFRDQNIVFEEALERLKTDNCVFLACSPGFGKTTIGNYLSGITKLKTVVLSHLDSINDQWEQEFKNFSTAKVQRIQGKKPIDHSADVYIVGVQKAATLDREELTDIGLLIFDEAHICTVSAFSKSLLKFQPKYVVGLSATPKRADGMDKLLTMYFGPKKSFITRKEVKDFTVIKVETNFKPEIKYQMVKGRMVPNWCIITNSIACNEDRQNLIVNLCLKHPEERILVLSDRQEQSRAVADKLIALGENVQLLIGAKKVKKITDEKLKARIIVGGTKKVGTGFDDPTLTMLILASDCKEVSQWEGRIRTTNNIIYDIVDDYTTFETHWSKNREPWFLGRGAAIEVMSLRPKKTSKSGSVPSRRLLGPVQKK